MTTAVVPKDTKDWTWVLERHCPECHFDTVAVTREAVVPLIREASARWRPLLAHPAVRVRPSEQVWSALEYGCHVRDVFEIYRTRLDRMLSEDDPLYPNWDQDETAVAERYLEQIPAEVAGQLETSADRLAKRFEAVSGNQWVRTGRRSDGAQFTVESFARYMIHDPIHHLSDVVRGFRALGSSMLVR